MKLTKAALAIDNAAWRRLAIERLDIIKGLEKKIQDLLGEAVDLRYERGEALKSNKNLKQAIQQLGEVIAHL